MDARGWGVGKAVVGRGWAQHSALRPVPDESSTISLHLLIRGKATEKHSCAGARFLMMLSHSSRRLARQDEWSRRRWKSY